MAALPPLQDLDDPDYQPALADELAFGDAQDPYPELHLLAARGSVHEIDLRRLWGLAPDVTAGRGRLFAVFGYEEVRTVFNTPEIFSNDCYRSGVADTIGAKSLTV